MFFLSQWYDIDRFTDTVETFVDDQPRILQSAQFVTGIVQELMASDGIPPEKIVIGGFSQGGAVALTAALHGLGKGANLGGVFALSSYLPMRDMYPAPMMTDPQVAARTPMLLVHGDSDDILPFEFGTVTAQKLDSLGANVEVRVYFYFRISNWTDVLLFFTVSSHIRYEARAAER